MTSHLPSIPSKRGQKSPSLQVILIASVALFILFLWLNFVLTQRIESIGREIQVKTAELDAAERRHGALLKEICEVGSEQEMANMAFTLGYRPQTPVYVVVGGPFVQASSKVVASGGQSATLPDGEEWGATVEANNLLGVLARQLQTPELGDGP